MKPKDVKSTKYIVYTSGVNKEKYMMQKFFGKNFVFNIFHPTSPMTINCNIFTFSPIKTEISQTIKDYQKLIIWQFSIQSRKVKG